MLFILKLIIASFVVFVIYKIIKKIDCNELKPHNYENIGAESMSIKKDIS